MITERNKFPHQHSLTPFKHQEQEFHKTKNKKNWALFWEMGTGKSKVIIDTAVHLFNEGEIDGVLIIAPKGGYLNWRDSEIPAHLHSSIPHRIAIWASVMNKKEQWEYSQIIKPQDNLLDFFIINVEAMSSSRATIAIENFIKSHYVLGVVDESTTIKSMKAQRTKALLKLRDKMDYRRILSGTPITQNPLDLYSQTEFLSRGLLGFRTYTEFRSYYAIMMNITISAGRSFPKILGFRNLDNLRSDIQKFGSRITKKECLDLPEKIYEMWYVDHTPEQHQIYHQLRDEAVVSFENGEISSITEALTAVLRLSQVNSGFLKGDDGGIHRIPSMRSQALIDVIKQVEGKVLIWARFHEDMNQIREALTNEFGPNSFGFYYGETSDKQRAETLRRFRLDDTCRFFVGSQAAGGMSLTLTEASTVIYYTNDYSLHNRLQSEDRAHRIGQRNNVTYIDLVTPKTIDEKILKAIRSKKDLASSVLDDFRELFV